MRLLIILFVAAGLAGRAFAGDCPAAGGDGRRAFVARAPSCEKAARRFKGCAIGARLDGVLALGVEGVCDKAYLSRLRGRERAAYRAAIEACNAPYAKKQGSIYRSSAAHCRVDIMAKYARGH